MLASNIPKKITLLMKQQLVFRIGDIRKNLEYYHIVQIIPVAVATRDEGAIMRGSA